MISQNCDKVNCVEFGRIAVREAWGDLFQDGNLTACHDQVAHFACYNSLRVDASQFARPAKKSSTGVLLPPLSFRRSPSARTSKGFLIVGQRVASIAEDFLTIRVLRRPKRANGRSYSITMVCLGSIPAAMPGRVFHQALWLRIHRD
jgi:hypothetical protein